MALIHLPAQSINTTDMFIDERVTELYAVRPDVDSEDPRTFIEDAHAAVYVYNGPRGRRDEVPENNIAETFAHYYERFGDDQTALRATRRWLKMLYPEIDEIVDLEIATVRGYSQGDWLDVFAVVSHGYGTPADHIEQYRQWAFGDVWVVSATEGVVVGGIYADSPADALNVFLADNPPAYERLIFESPLVNAVADALCDRGDETAARWLHDDEDRLWSDTGDISLGILLDAISNQAAATKKDPTT